VPPIPWRPIVMTSSLRQSERAAVWLPCLGNLLTVAPTACAQDTEKLPIVGVSHLPRDLSPWTMFVNADAIVQAVIVGLACASVVTWTVCLAKCLELFVARRTLSQSLALVSRQRLLSHAAVLVTNRRGMLPALIDAACRELALSADIQERSGIKQRIAISLSRLEVAGGRDMNKGTQLLATIGATAPFVGLFGTVWGIMNRFVGISKAQTTNLAVAATRRLGRDARLRQRCGDLWRQRHAPLRARAVVDEDRALAPLAGVVEDHDHGFSTITNESLTSPSALASYKGGACRPASFRIPCDRPGPVVGTAVV
jgi:tonB-system energizer ExbB